MEIAGKYFRERKLTREETILTAAVAAINIPSVREYLSETIRLNLPEEKAFPMDIDVDIKDEVENKTE